MKEENDDYRRRRLKIQLWKVQRGRKEEIEDHWRRRLKIIQSEDLIGLTRKRMPMPTEDGNIKVPICGLSMKRED